MSLISYRMQRRPQSAHASWMLATIAALSEARSSNVLSRVIFPSSERIVVCASWTTAKAASETP